MGKYTEGYARVSKDRYITPRSAITRLDRYFDLSGIRYIEPCFAEGSIQSHLAASGALCAYASGLEPEVAGVEAVDALGEGEQGYERAARVADVILTNPPWDRALLHPMIARFSDAAPSLLLFDSNWINTKQAGVFQDRLVAVFQAGRHRWFEGQDGDKGMSPKEDTSWYLFDRPMAGRLPHFVLKPFDEGPVSLKKVLSELQRTGKFCGSGSA